MVYGVVCRAAMLCIMPVFVFTWEYMDVYMHVMVQCVYSCVQSVCSVLCVSRVCCGVCRVLVCGCRLVAEPAWQCMAMQGMCV